MANRTFRPAQTGFSRVFLIEGRARPDHRPSYQSSMMAGGVSQSFGDITKIEVPDPNNFDGFIEIGTIRGASERATVSLTGVYASDLKSEMLRLATKGCAIDVQIIFGVCTDPSDYNTFTKKLILEDARIISYETEDLGSLESGDRAKVDETVEISARSFFEIVPVSWASKAGDVVTNEVLDITVCGVQSCGDCEDESDGCQQYFAITKAAGGSPSTPADVVYTLDGGLTWAAHDVDSLGVSDDPSAIVCVSSYVVVASEASESLHYALASQFKNSDPAFTEVATGFITGGGPRAMSEADGIVFVAGAGGYLYKSEDVTAGVTVLDGAVLTISDYNDIHALNDEFAVAVGNDGVIAKTENGSTFALVTTTPVGVGVNLNAVWVKTESEWFIGTSTGLIYYTVDGGATWTSKSFSGSGAGAVHDIVFANDTTAYVAHETAAGAGRILRSTNGGFDWVIMPEGSGILPANDRINAIAACPYNQDRVIAVGLADDASDGFILVGSD